MKISELIKELESIMDVHGDLSISMPTDESCNYMSIEDVWVNEDKDDYIDDHPIGNLDDQMILVIGAC